MIFAACRAWFKVYETWTAAPTFTASPPSPCVLTKRYAGVFGRAGFQRAYATRPAIIDEATSYRPRKDL